MSEDKKEKRYLYYEIAEDIEILNKKVSALEKQNNIPILTNRIRDDEVLIRQNFEKLKELEGWKRVVDKALNAHSRTISDLDKRYFKVSELEEKLKEQEHTIGARALGKHSLYELLLDYKTENTMKINELEQRIIHIKKCAEGEALSQVGAIKNIEAVLRDMIFACIGQMAPLGFKELVKFYQELLKKLGSEEKAYTEGLGGIPFAGQKPIEKSPAEDLEFIPEYSTSLEQKLIAEFIKRIRGIRYEHDINKKPLDYIMDSLSKLEKEYNNLYKEARKND